MTSLLCDIQVKYCLISKYCNRFKSICCLLNVGDQNSKQWWNSVKNIVQESLFTKVGTLRGLELSSHKVNFGRLEQKITWNLDKDGSQFF